MIILAIFVTNDNVFAIFFADLFARKKNCFNFAARKKR